MKKNSKVVTIPELLKEAKDDLQAVMQWSHDYPRQVEYSIRTETLIELVEVMDCGSTGGFGNGQEYGIEPDTLFHRWLWLANKYWPEGTKKIDDMRKFFPYGKKDPK